MKTLNSRIKFLAQEILNAMGSNETAYVENGKWHSHYMHCGKGGGKFKHMRFSYRGVSGDLDVIASVICAVARQHGLNARWTNEFSRHEIIIHFTVDYGFKVSEAATDLPTDFSALAGFEADTNSSLQLFGGNGFNSADRQRVLALLS